MAGAGAADRETRKTVSVVFCDLVDSTVLGERLDPELLREVLGRYFELGKGAFGVRRRGKGQERGHGEDSVNWARPSGLRVRT